MPKSLEEVLACPIRYPFSPGKRWRDLGRRQGSIVVGTRGFSVSRGRVGLCSGEEVVFVVG